MRRALVWGTILWSAVAGSATASAAAPADAPAAISQAAANELVAADRAFSTAGAQRPLADSVAAMFAPDVMMPLPNATFAQGKEAAVAALRANPANMQASATWEPVRAGISADGTHGFTYGFMKVRESGKPDRRLKYLAYWTKGREGWRVAAYKRAGSPEGDVQSALRTPILSAAAQRETAVEAHRASLIAAEKAFSDRAQDVGLAIAFTEFGSRDAMNMGAGPDFTYGNTSIGADMPPDPRSPVTWAADLGALVSPSGDLGVTFGYIRSNQPPPPGQPAQVPFFTVWHRAGGGQPWRYIAE